MLEELTSCIDTMKFKITKHRYDSIQIAIGEEGAVVVHSEAGYAKTKLFVRSTEVDDSAKLVELLEKHTLVPIYIYIDTLDQSYVQRTLPGVGQIGINSIAQKRLDKEVPKGYFKAHVQIGRSMSGRQDWIFTFISAAFEHPLSTWINFLMPFKNVITGIYFMPVELYAVVQKLKKLAIENRQYNVQEDKKSKTKRTLLDLLRPKASASESKWELYFSQNKTGGFRQVAFQDGKIIFSRLINNINDPSAEVVAGNIEQEIANSIEYMTRLSLGKEKEIDVYLVIAGDIIKHLRKDRIRSNNLFSFTPFELAHKLKVPEASTEKDKFADPTILTFFSKQTAKYITLHTDATRKVYWLTQFIDKLGVVIYLLIPILFIANLYFINGIIDIKSSIKQIQNKTLGFAAQLTEQNKNLSLVSSKIQDSLDIDHVNEISDVYGFLNKYNVMPTDVVFRLSSSLPQYARIKSIKWDYKDEALVPTSKSSEGNVLTMKERKYGIIVEMEVVIKSSGKTFEELEGKYKEFNGYVTSKLNDFDVSISELPQNFSFQDITKPISIKVKASYPKDEKAVPEKLPPAQQVNTGGPQSGGNSFSPTVIQNSGSINHSAPNNSGANNKNSISPSGAGFSKPPVTPQKSEGN